MTTICILFLPASGSLIGAARQCFSTCSHVRGIKVLSQPDIDFAGLLRVQR